jgi:hypothetical protein
MSHQARRARQRHAVDTPQQCVDVGAQADEPLVDPALGRDQHFDATFARYVPLRHGRGLSAGGAFAGFSRREIGIDAACGGQ